MLYLPAFLLGFAILVVITRPFTTLFHELGHAIPIMLATKRGVTVYVGSYGNKKQSLHLTLGSLDIWIRYNPIGWSGGLCVSEASAKTIVLQIVSVMGGVVFSFVIMIILVYIAFSQDMHGAVKLITVFALGSTLFDLYCNLIPREFKSADGATYYSDGYLLRMLLPLRKYPADYLEALTLYTQNNHQGAAKIFHRMLTDGHQDRTIYKMAYAAYMQAKDYEASIPIYSEYKEKYALDADDYYNHGLLNSYLKLNRERDECYKKALELNPNHAATLNNIGYSLITAKRFNEAIPYLDKAIKYMSTMAYAYNNRGHALLETGKLEQGVSDIKHSLKLDDTNAYAHRNLGIYHLKLEQYEMAHNLFLKAREITPETDLIDELLQQTSAKINPQTTS